MHDTPVVFCADYMESCNILVLPELTYDVIIGQAWLASHKARLDCATNMLTFCSMKLCLSRVVARVWLMKNQLTQLN